MPRLTHDRDADAIYIYLHDAPYGYGRDLDDERRVDCAADGTIIGVELLDVSHGVNLDDLPQRDTVAELLASERIKVFA